MKGMSKLINIIFLIIFLIGFSINISYTRGLIFENYTKNSQTLNESSIFYFITPENKSILYEIPFLSYFLSNLSAQLEFYLNGSVLENNLNNTALNLKIRGNYNLTGSIQSNNDTVVESVFFGYFPIVSLDLSYDTIYYNDFIHPSDYSQPIPCYKHNETVFLQAIVNEKNITLDILISYKVSSNLYELNSNNFTWVNETCFNLVIQPLEFNATTHKLIFNVTSSLLNGTNSIIFYFYRAINPPFVAPDQYENFVNTVHKGIVQGHFTVWRGISDLTNISVFLDSQLIQYYYNQNGIEDFPGYLTLVIDTTQYEDGEHELRIIVTDFFNLTTDMSYVLTFDNSKTPTDGTPTMPVYLKVILISSSVIVVVLIILLLLNKKYGTRFISRK